MEAYTEISPSTKYGFHTDASLPPSQMCFPVNQAIDSPQYIKDELLVIFHIGSMNLQQVIIAARYIIAFGHLGNILYDPGNSAAISLFSRLSLTLQKTTKP